MLSKQPITSLITSINIPQISHKKIGLYNEILDNVIYLHASYKAPANLSVAGPLGHGWGVLVFAVFSVICCSLRLVYIHVRFITFSVPCLCLLCWIAINYISFWIQISLHCAFQQDMHCRRNFLMKLFQNERTMMGDHSTHVCLPDIWCVHSPESASGYVEASGA